ncbi:MAG TPA: hypothetical protein VI755_11965 [Anaerolineales bacterium]|nr:hypothetical protein [Anaerolineales bacterium]
MSRNKLISIVMLGALAVAAVFGVVAYRSANAAAPAAITPIVNGYAHFDRGIGGYNNEDLADALGVSVDALNTAYQKATDAALDQAVEDGLITQAQADQIRDRGAAFPMGGRWGGWLSQNGIDFDALLADALGITVEKLQEAYIQAFEARIDQAVADGNLTQEKADLMKGRRALFSSESFRSAIQSAFESAVKQAVSAGVITQAQADLILKNETNLGFPGFRGFGGFPGFGGFGEFNGPHGFGRHGLWGGDAPLNPTTPQPTPETP